MSTHTKPDRYPDLFRAAQAHLEAEALLSILSFRCSAGEEAFALRKYFPAARIVGVDINEQALAAARRRNQDANIHFLYSSPGHLEVNAPYDAIFCLNVLQRSGLSRGWMRSNQRVYPSERFDEQIKVLDAVLKPGGILALFRSNYRLFDSSVGYKYTTLPGSSFAMYDKARKYDRRNRCIGRGAVEDVLFVKRRDSSKAEGTLVDDVISEAGAL